MINIPEIFGSQVFNDSVMKNKLPKEIYKSLKKTIEKGEDLDIGLANVVAAAMKDWALEQGATHYTHWFQPLTGVTAEKHDSFISPTGNGTVIMEFSGKELIKGESDASSFPSGGLRATFEARGYTAWDPTSPAFVKDGTLYIPTVFCSYGGQTLDTKTPLLRSMEELNREALRILRLFGDTVTNSVATTVGPEQEYFLIDKELYLQRKDLMFTGRTLFGAPAPKGQEMEDHYYGTIKPRVAAFMRDLDEALWRLGVLAKTKHNEVAPAQHELAPIFSTTNVAVDGNHLTMEMMRRIAADHGMICLLHEKPFAGVNGSGKHNNWSLSTDTGRNLLDPGKTPAENAQFLLFLASVIVAVDEYQGLLRVSVASAGNDHRLGANEAPPAIISIFLGDELTAILRDVESGASHQETPLSAMELGVHVLPSFPKDNTDRNRTSPFAFTGNKFEFRMLGSAQNIAQPNTVLNTAVADVLSRFANRLEGAENVLTEARELVKEAIRDHKRIIFNGNGYSEEWTEEATRRGLLNLSSTVACLPQMLERKNIDLFVRHGIYTEQEIESRYEISLEGYVKTINIEALTALEMLSREILPAISAYIADLGDATKYEKAVRAELIELCDRIYDNTRVLEAVTAEGRTIDDLLAQATFYRDRVLTAMLSVRKAVDLAETKMPTEYWPMPTYTDLMFRV
ncbi:MAG: glutamine synthetase III [Oscillospiraceae bacterium]|nr:glutamine synthetase III [Oscillospiraceae bacterium]